LFIFGNFKNVFRDAGNLATPTILFAKWNFQILSYNGTEELKIS